MARAALMLLVYLSAAAATPGAAADGARHTLTWDGRCTEIAFGASVPAERVRALVPGRFTLLGESAGTALLNVGIAECPAMIVDGVEQPAAYAGFTAVFIEPYEGSGAQRYMLWLASDSRPLHRGFRDLGLPSIHSPSMRMFVTSVAIGIRAEGTVPPKGNQGGYDLAVDSSLMLPAPARADAVYWHIGKRGLVRLDIAVEFQATGVGPAELHAKPGTLISTIAGGERLSGGALLADFAFEGAIELV